MEYGLTAHGPTIDEVIERSRMFRGRAVATTFLTGGHMNAAFLVQAGDARFVVRIPAGSGGLLVPDRENERHNTVAAAAAGVAPRLVEYLEDWQVMVLEFVDGQMLTDETIGELDRLPRIAATLRSLHSAPRFRADFDMYRTAGRWLRICDEQEIAVPEGLRERMPRLRLGREALAARPIGSTPCHNDLSSDNLIDDGRRLWLIDFEYGGNNDPCYDLGDLAAQASFDERRRALLCEAYFGAADVTLLARMRLHATISFFGWAVWAAIQRRVSPLEVDFAEIADWYWDQARAMLDSEEFPRLVHTVFDRRVSM